LVVKSVVSRVVSTLAELLCVGVAYLSGGSQMRAVQLEQAAQVNSPPAAQVTQAENQEAQTVSTNESSTVVTTQLVAERGAVDG
jgi:hypothetical protein